MKMKLEMPSLSRFVCLLACLLLGLSVVGNFVSQVEIPQAKAQSSGQWYKIQMDTHTGYSAYLSSAKPASLYKTVEAWKKAGFTAVFVKDYFFSIPQSGFVSYVSQGNNPDPANGWWNYSVSGSPSHSAANFSTTYPNMGGSSSGSGRLYVNGTGKAMVTLYHSTYSAQSARFTLDLYRHIIIDEFGHYTSSYSGSVATGIEIIFDSGRKIILYQSVGTTTYSNSTSVQYYRNLKGTRTVSPYTVVNVMSVTGQYLGVRDDYNAYLNITKAYLKIWGQSAYLNDKIDKFLWFTESFNSSSWINCYFDKFEWSANSNWSSYLKDIAFAESSHGIIIIPGLEVTVGPPKNQMWAFNINSSGITYDGTIAQFLTTSTQTANRNGTAFLEELYMFPNGTSYTSEAQRSPVDWLNRGFHGFATHPNTGNLHLWDNALKIIFDEERSERMWIVKGSDLHGNYTQKTLRSWYSMVYIEGTPTKQKIIDAINNGHTQVVVCPFPNEVIHTNITITDFSIGSWIMGDWATPTTSPVLNIGVSADVDISNVTLYWNGKILRSWTPGAKSVIQSLNLDVSGVLRLMAKDQNNVYKAYGNPIFLKPNGIPYIIETTHPKDLTASYSSDKLNFTVSAPSGTTTTTKVYVGDKGEPTQVYTINGNLTSSYNASTTILTLNLLHDGPANILVDWRIPGDVDGDGKVDASDLTELSAAYGSTSASPNWNQNCDFNRDNIISVLDLYPLGKNYGKTKPP